MVHSIDTDFIHSILGCMFRNTSQYLYGRERMGGEERVEEREGEMFNRVI